MNKLYFIFGFLLPLPIYFNDSIAEYLQNIGGNFWILFSNLGFIFYPLYSAIFIVPLFLVISWVIAILNHNQEFTKIFIRMLFGFIVSSCIFILFAFIAISQFQFGF